MENEDNLSYVYAYYDPRNFKLFYIGKGVKDRKKEHLNEIIKNQDNNENEENSNNDLITKKNEILKAIYAQKDDSGNRLRPIIRVIASNLSNEQAELVETALIWSNFEHLTNIVAGKFSKNFRPKNTLHYELPGFDYVNQFYYVNIGQGEDRDWEDCIKYGFIAAGGSIKWKKKLDVLSKDDIIFAYYDNIGYLGCGRVLKEKVKFVDHTFNNQNINAFKEDFKNKKIFDNSNDDDIAQYCVAIEWLKFYTKDEIKNTNYSNRNVFHGRSVISKLANQNSTIEYLLKFFEINDNSKIKNLCKHIEN